MALGNVGYFSIDQTEICKKTERDVVVSIVLVGTDEIRPVLLAKSTK